MAEADMSINQTDINRAQRAFTNAVREHWKLFLIEGLVLVVLGMLAVALAPVATLAVTIVLGWLLLASGIVGLITTFWMRQAPGFWWALLSALIGIAVGVMLLVAPLRGAFSLTIVLVAFFFIEGVASIMYAFDHRRELSGRWGWMLVSGIVDLGLGAMIYGGLPSTAAWAVGLLVGINMMFGGWALILMAMHARNSA
jgi:uncharacterized membrane protein HdeD (DUF308 family)